MKPFQLYPKPLAHLTCKSSPPRDRRTERPCGRRANRSPSFICHALACILCPGKVCCFAAARSVFCYLFLFDKTSLFTQIVTYSPLFDLTSMGYSYLYV